MKCMQCSVEDGCILRACFKIRKIIEKLYEVSVKFSCIIHKFSAASKKTRADGTIDTNRSMLCK